MGTPVAGCSSVVVVVEVVVEVVGLVAASDKISPEGVEEATALGEASVENERLAIDNDERKRLLNEETLQYECGRTTRRCPMIRAITGRPRAKSLEVNMAEGKGETRDCMLCLCLKREY